MLRSLLASDRLIFVILGVVILLTLPSVWLGWQIDDYVHRASLVGVEPFPDVSRPWWNLFGFVEGDPDVNRRYISGGALPWWSAIDLRLAFFRPITGLTHKIDYLLWPQTPALMHVQTIAWYLGAVIMMFRLYRNVATTALAAGVAALAFSIDDAHGMPVAWLANRNSVIALFFGATSLYMHIKWREGGSSKYAWVSALALACALLSAEAAVATLAYIFSYSVFLDRGTVARRVQCVVPAACVTVIWLLAYKVLGYGASGSGIYIDPLANPIRFAGAVVQRVPLLLWGQWAWPPADFHQLMSAPIGRAFWFVVFAFTIFLVLVLIPTLRIDRPSRFWAAGMVLAALPVCATFSSDRLLMFVGIGGAGLLGTLLSGNGSASVQSESQPRRRLKPRMIAAPLIVIHFAIAPLGLLLTPTFLRSFGVLMDRSIRSLPTDDTLVDQEVLVVHTPSAFLTAFGPVILAMDDRPVPRRLLALGSSIYPLEIERPDGRTLRFRPEHGFLAPNGLPHPGQSDAQPPADPLYIITQFDHLYRDAAQPFRLGEHLPLNDLNATVTALTNDGRPAEVTFQFPHALEHPRYHWVQWQSAKLVPFNLPAIGKTVRLLLEHKIPLP